MLLCSRRFFPFFSTFFLGAFNDNMFRNALVILITYQSGLEPGRASALSFLAMALLMVPQFFFSSIAGEIADKYPQQTLFRAIKLAEVVLMALTLAAFLAGSISSLLILIFLMGTQSAFFSPVKYAYVPRTLPDELIHANGLVGAGTYLAILLGAVAGNVFITCGNGKFVTGLFLLAVAGLGYLASLKVPASVPVSSGLKLNWNILSGTWDILKIVFRDFTLRHCTLGLSIFWMAGALYVSQLAGFCREIIGANESLVMTFTLLFSAGVGLGSYLCSLFRKNANVLAAVSPALVLMGLFTLDLFFASGSWTKPCGDGVYANLSTLIRIPSFWRFTADLLLLAACGGFYSVPLISLLQKTAEPGVMARVVAGNNIINAAMIAFGTVCSAVLMNTGLLNVRGIFLLVAAVNILAALYLLPLRKSGRI